jgi:hypothetical protein
METDFQDSVLQDEKQSLQLIHGMIQVSQKKLKNDGILFILWGWLMFYNYISSYILGQVVTTYQLRKIFEYGGNFIGILAIAYTIYYIVKQRRKVQTYIGISLRYVWFSLIISMVLINLILFNIQKGINFELQHPVFMVIIAFATVITGGILRYRLIIIGGIIFGILAYISSYFNLQEQLLLESVAWLIAFIIPGHIMYLKRKG